MIISSTTVASSGGTDFIFEIWGDLMRVVIAPDAFKGSLSAIELCEVIASAIRKVEQDADIITIPLADGGEGTVATMVRATDGVIYKEVVTGPLGHPVEATYGILGDGETVVIEVAEASGLTLVPQEKRNPFLTTSYGTGELISKALDQGYRDFIIGLGGSACNDGGMGLLRALGMQFLDKNGDPLPEGGGSLQRLARIDDADWHPAISASTFTIASDVDNRLCGYDGASAVYGPQKGATPEMVRKLDQSLAHYAHIVEKEHGIDMLEIIGGGAAGGIGAACAAFLNGNIQSGIQVMFDVVNWQQQIAGADLIITGEGQLDEQTLSGKAIKGVCESARTYHVPVIALSGSVELSVEQLDQLGVIAAFPIVSGPMTVDQAIEQASDLTGNLSILIFRLIQYMTRG